MQSMKSRILRAEEFPELPIQMEADLGLHSSTSRESPLVWRTGLPCDNSQLRGALGILRVGMGSPWGFGRSNKSLI